MGLVELVGQLPEKARHPAASEQARMRPQRGQDHATDDLVASAVAVRDLHTARL